MYLIAGLGNPDRKYEGTRHNIGFETLDLFVHNKGLRFNKIKHKAVLAETVICGEKAIIAKPQTYMNLSGESIREIVNFYKIPTENVIVVCDDINLETGRIRIRPKGSDGGHNGLKNIIQHLGSEEFQRIRIGVGEKPAGYDLADYVLGHFSKEEQPLIREGVEKAMKAATMMLEGDVDRAMNEFNRKKMIQERDISHEGIDGTP